MQTTTNTNIKKHIIKLLTRWLNYLNDYKRDSNVTSKIMTFYEYVMHTNIHNTFITNIVSKKIDDKYYIKLTCLKPGIIIGKQGLKIDKLTNYLETHFQTDVHIQVIENTIYQHKNKNYENSN